MMFWRSICICKYRQAVFCKNLKNKYNHHVAVINASNKIFLWPSIGADRVYGKKVFENETIFGSVLMVADV